MVLTASPGIAGNVMCLGEQGHESEAVLTNRGEVHLMAHVAVPAGPEHGILPEVVHQRMLAPRDGRRQWPLNLWASVQGQRQQRTVQDAIHIVDLEHQPMDTFDRQVGIDAAVRVDLDLLQVQA